MFEHLLEADPAELPECRCGQPMKFAGSKLTYWSGDAHVNVYLCAACGHELRVTVWPADSAT